MKKSAILVSLASFVGISQSQSDANDFFLKNTIVGGMTCVIVQHEVVNYEKWKTAYDNDEARRKKAGIQEMLVLRGDSNANSITVVFELNDLESSKAFFTDPKTAELMGEAGVISKPSFIYFKVANSGITDGTSYMIISHKVEEYNRWKKAFDQHASVRAAYSIDLTAVGKNLDESATIVAIFTSKQTSNFINFLEKSDLKEAMKNAGVISEPEIAFLNSVK